MKDCYNIYTYPFVSRNYNNCIDYIFLQEEDNKQKLSSSYYLVRITNIITEFLVVKFPGMKWEDFQDQIEEITEENDCELKTISMKDSQLFSFDYQYKYCVISSTNIWNINKCYKAINNFANKEYSKLHQKNNNWYYNDKKLDYYDELLYKYSESPFRYVMNTTNISNLPYHLATKYDIPLIGPIKFNLSKFKEFKTTDYINSENSIKEKFFKKLYTVDFKNLIQGKLVEESHNSEPLNSLKIIAYDIETYNPNTNPDSNKKDQPIICIGFSIFNINDPTPIKRYCIISNDFSQEDIQRYKQTKQTVNSCQKYYLYDYLPETNYDNVKTDFGATDETVYICCGLKQPDKTEFNNKDGFGEEDYLKEKQKVDYQNEAIILENFITIINQVKPFLITGFNNWKFDDIWIYNKSKIHKIEEKLLSSLSYYKQSTAKFKTIRPKIDGEVVKDNQYNTFINGFCSVHDVMFAAKKEDPKKFSQRNRANLETMLKVFNIVSPYNGKVLSKTDMKIAKMFQCWRDNEHIYLIAKYCCQDAWITGCLAISRNMFGDLIEMSNMTNTNFNDSLHKAVGIRVTNTIHWYAQHENIAYYDVPDNESRNFELHSSLGLKYFDKRTLIGGAVKNKRNGREFFIQALDFSSMYPSQKEGSNTDTSSRIDPIILQYPEKFGLTLVEKYYIEDIYTDRWVYKLKNSKNIIYTVEEFFCEYKIDPKKVKELNKSFHEIRLNEDISPEIRNSIEQYLLKRMLDLINGEDENYLNRKNYGNKIEEQEEKAKYLLIKDNLSKEILPIQDKLNDFEKYLVNKYEKFNIPTRVLLPIYFIQSPKDEITNLPIYHYSLKEKMLSDLRAKRSKVKKTKPKNLTEEKQLNAKQLAIKVVMNSEYGQTGSDLFAHYDSDIGAAVTFASRKCIGELTSCLLSEHFYVDEKYLKNEHLLYLIKVCESFNDNSVKIEKITYQPTFDLSLEGTQRKTEDIERIKTECFDENGNFIKSIDIYNEIDFRLPPRRLTCAKVYEKLREQVKENINSPVVVYRITLPKSQLVYQDTDSNYYTNEYFVSLWDKLNPDTINEIMTMLFQHDSLLADLISEIIYRRPIGVGWEGAFIVARYLNKKKKYYGKKWTIPAEGGLMKSTITIPRSLDYEMNDYEKEHHEIVNNKLEITYDWKNLPEDYEDYLSTKIKNKYPTYNTTIPFRDGSYLRISDFPENVDPLDFVNSNGIKCTGVDLARRDQFRFININNMLVYQNDLKYCDENLEVENPIKYNKPKEQIKPVIDKLIENFGNVKLEDYPLEDYCKTKAYHSDRQTEVPKVVGRLERDINTNIPLQNKINLKNCVPIEGERCSYVIIDKNNKYGINTESDKICDEAYILNHLRNKPLIGISNTKPIYRKLLKNTFETIKSNEEDNSQIFVKINSDFIPIDKKDLEFEENKYYVIEYLTMTEEQIFDSLDFQYYHKCLCDVLYNFVVIETCPSIVKYIDGSYAEQHPDKSDKEIEQEMGKIIKKEKDRLTKEYINAHYEKTKNSVLNKIIKYDKSIDYNKYLPDLSKLYNLERQIENQTNLTPKNWQQSFGNPEVYNLIKQRILLIKRNTKIDLEIKKEIIILYEQLETYLIKRYNLDNSRIKIYLYKNGMTKKEQKFILFYNYTDEDYRKNKIKLRNEDKIEIQNNFSRQIFPNIYIIYNLIKTSLKSEDIEIIDNNNSEKEFKFKIRNQSIEKSINIITNLFNIISEFDIEF